MNNRTTANGESYTTNSLNQYTAAGQTSYSYDNKGNLTGDGTWTYGYDYENRFVSATDGNTSASYTYDYSGRRIAKTVGGTTTRYIYDGVHIIAEYDTSSNLLQKNIFGPGIDEILKRIDYTGQDPVNYYYHKDGLGSVVTITDSNAAIAEKYFYDAYGNVTIKDSQDQVLSQSAINNRYMFTGREYDHETSLYYYRARMYDAYLGRFLQTDPIGYYDSMNLYQYCGNNPVNWVDPWGLQIIVQWHSVGGSKDYHAFITIIPNNQSRYENDPRFNNIDAQGRRYATIGAGPEGNRLVSNINRRADRVPHTGGIEVNPPDDKCEDAFIDQLFQLDRNYRDNLDYDLWPANSGNRKWWIADDGYNSNSYTAGILGAAGANVATPPVNLPGWDVPVPIGNFGGSNNE